ncbi:hypothetical protein [Camelimonas lactis]|uniref:Uncharacterized protein n=1 Tax=Camelimonas lactis TaxID=659006 RepID=A0A4R2GSD6_9HYPH|nr:hypothetical protein [Camelimonas lactis]TCO12358.1 hypothetical protein EV666_1093 [Camelimonas lactis]
MGLTKKVADLLGLAKKSTSTAAELQSALESAKADAEATQADLESAEAAYLASLTDLDEAASARADDARSAARRSADRAVALVELIESRLADAIAREAQAAKRAAYDAAKAASAKASADLVRIYPKAAIQIRDVLLAVAQAEVDVQAANEDLPEGAERLHGPETQLILAPGYEREDISSEEIELWCVDGDRSRVLPDDQQKKVRRIEGNRALYAWPGGDPNLNVTLRKFRKEVYYPHRSPDRAKSPLAVTVLPDLNTHAPDIWNSNGTSGSYALATMKSLIRKGGEYVKPAEKERELQTDLIPLLDDFGI